MKIDGFNDKPKPIEPTSGPPKPKGHGPLFSGACPVCTHAFRDGIELLYLEFRKPSMIAEVAGVSETDLEKHAIATGLDKQRADNTEELTRYALNKSFDRGVLDNLDADQTLRLLQHREKVMGKVSERPDSRPPSVVIVGVPMIGRSGAEGLTISAGEVRAVETDDAEPLFIPRPK